MKKNKKYLQASKLIIQTNKARKDDKKHFYACTALIELKQCKDNFEKFFKPENKNSNSSWWTKGSDGSLEDQLARQLALLLMYEMGEK